jgi:hypothetical protein
MKRIINGKTYNTDTARRICDAAPGAPPVGSDFRGEDSDLYQTKRGRFFVAGEGGPMTRWARPCDINSVGGGEGIVLVTEEEAREIMERAGCDEDDFVAVGLAIEEG